MVLKFIKVVAEDYIFYVIPAAGTLLAVLIQMQMIGTFEVMQEYQLKHGYLIGEALVVLKKNLPKF